MTVPAEELRPLPKRSPGAVWGAAHLAWGIAIFLALLYAAWQLPIDSSPWLQRLGIGLFFSGLFWLAVTGWRQVELGWRLRRPTESTIQLMVFDLLSDGAIGAVALFSLLRGEQSRVLAAGLDRLVSALVTVSIVSMVLWVAGGRTRSGEVSRSTLQPLERRLNAARYVLAAIVIAIAAVMEFSAW